MQRLIDDAYIWRIARATQLLTSNDAVVRSISWKQLDYTISRRFKGDVPDPVPYDDYLSGVSSGGMFRFCFGNHPTTTLWSLAREAARELR